jgi:MGT family glycosyltransferase
MGLLNKTLGQAILNDKPALNIVYVPQIFQAHRETFGADYLFTVSVSDSGAMSGQIPYEEIPYEKMKPPVVYISLGSLISNKGFCQECMRAFGGKDMSVILNTGKVPPETLGKVPGNIYAYSFVPQVEVLRRADVFLTHCGMNSVNEAMSCGVPMVAMPFINDQISNAKRIVELGIGKRVRSFPSSGRQLYRTVCDVYDNEQIRNRSAEVQSLLKNEMTLEDVVGRIEKLFGASLQPLTSPHTLPVPQSPALAGTTRTPGTSGPTHPPARLF